jgi:signal transduction histidine kinase
MPLTTHAFLRSQGDRIIREWEALVAAEPRRIALPEPLLRDHLPELLSELADWLERDELVGGERMRAAAARHAAQRLDQSLSLAELISEFRLLRVTLLRLLLEAEADEQEGGTLGMADRVRELARLNSALDFALTDGIEEFVAERDRREREAAQASEWRRTDFLGVLAHELRNPLAPIHNSLYVLEKVPGDSEPARRAQDVIRRQAGQLARLVDDLLDVTRIARGKFELRPQALDLRGVVRSACDDHRSTYERAGLQLRYEEPDREICVEADPSRLTQVVGNLLANAAKFTPAGGVVTLRVEASDEGGVIRVRDTGIGIEPSEIEHLFSPFAQAEGARPREGGGLGLGLPLARGLIELHGGTLHASSEGPRRGAEFVVTLPFSRRHSAVAAAKDATALRPLRVLVVEDNVDSGDTLADVLRLAGHEVRVARDGRSGLEAARAFRPGVVICDLGLPDIPGYEVARAMRADETLRGTRLLALSGYARPEDMAQASEAGFDAHLAKPVAPETLTSTIANLSR